MRLSSLLAAATLAGCATSGLPPPNAPAAPAQVEVRATGIQGQAAAEQTMTITATVAAVDYDARTITLQDRDQWSEKMKVPPDVTGFDRVTAGDTIELVFRRSLLLEYQPPGAAVVAPRDVAVAGWPGLADPPAGSGASARQATVTIADIDLKARLLTFQGPARNQYQVKVGPKVALEKLKPGDKLLATFVDSSVMQIVKGGQRR
jgi:Cu/Ag efflux protein CusF